MIVDADGGAPMRMDDVRQELFSALPHLRAFAISLTGDIDRADDLVQEAVVRGLSHLHQFKRGTNFQGWMFTILRNQFHSNYRKRRREVEDADGAYAAKFAVAPEQGARLDFGDFREALTKLSPEQREAILLIGAEGLTYEETAEVCNTKVGTIKSRVNRARKRLAELLGYEKIDEIGPDGLVQAALRDDIDLRVQL
ncbi:MAG TPA: sigma-70 family RNA polymerase sigma factor [Beijerinckiaceae bacterium]|nr:sigma-70 family RNA polymerase sigma factor [Beijerinckiaceae bacterium]